MEFLKPENFICFLAGVSVDKPNSLMLMSVTMQGYLFPLLLYHRLYHMNNMGVMIGKKMSCAIKV